MKIPLPFRPRYSGFSNYFRWTFLLFAVFAVGLSGYSCAKNTDSPEQSDNGCVLEFSSAITGYGKTRVTDTQWDEEDMIGVFMFRNGETASNASQLAYNKNYYTEGDGNFIPSSVEDRITLTEEDGPADIIAYYPYDENLNGYIYNVDITDQAVQQNLDLLYADNVKAVTPTGAIDPLSFSRQMSKIVLNITNSGPGGAEALRNLEAQVTGAHTKGMFDLLSGTLIQDETSVADFNMSLLTTLDGRAAEAIMMPTQDVTKIKFVLTLGDEKFTVGFPAGKTLERGGRLTYSVKINSSEPPVVEPVNGWIELPTASEIANTEQLTHMMIDGRNFTLLYDKKYMVAYWVAYPLVKMHFNETVKRTNAWKYDPTIATAYQANLSDSYPDENYDRGHQIPSGDRTHNKEANQQTFYYTNMTPQHRWLNQKAWMELEKQLRKWTEKCDTMYVVTGAMLFPENQMEYVLDKDNKNIAKPQYYYKALARRTGDTYSTVAYKYTNEPTYGTDFHNYALTVKELEALTGFTFFPSLPDAVKSNTNVSNWN